MGIHVGCDNNIAFTICCRICTSQSPQRVSIHDTENDGECTVFSPSFALHCRNETCWFSLDAAGYGYVPTQVALA
jgi:hypothetical protein